MALEFSRSALLAAACAAAAGTLAMVVSRAEDTKSTELPHPAQHHFVMHGKGEIFDLGDEIDEVKLTAAQTEGRYSIQDERWHPGYVVPKHYHKEHAETFYLLDGQYEWTVGGETHVMSAGDLVYIPPNTVHTVRVIGNKDAHVLFIYEPGGYEHYEHREMSYSKEQRDRPEIRKKLREESDFNLVK